MKTIKHGGHRLFERDATTTLVVSEMLRDIEEHGMDAVRKYSRQFDDWDPESFELSDADVAVATAALDPQVIDDIAFCQANVRAFAEAQRQTLQPLEFEPSPGIVLGHKLIPVGTVGSYVPGGVYPMPSSAQMSIIPPKVAGVETVVACTPPVKGQGYYPATVHAMQAAGADRILILGGVQAIALMAFGLGNVEPADMLCGAGNQYVAEAKRQLFGRCGIDLLAGPSEALMIADDSADPTLVAADLLAQAEHDPASGTCLVCLSEGFARAAVAELDRQIVSLASREIAGHSWLDNGIVLVADDADEAIRLSDDYAPEHLELHVRDVDYYFDRLANYGSLFIGQETTVAYGDMAIGTNHILPTSRAARYTGGVWVGMFLKTCTWQRATPEASRAIAEVTARQCRLEHLPAHTITAELRAKQQEDVTRDA
ncbi:histidinol dehydrogenase [bacterium]|nr:histidinol dehydrogenase [bacterium]